MGGPGPPTPFKLFQNHWAEKLQPYVDAGLLMPSGVKCPEDGNELLVFGEVRQGIAVEENKPIIRTQFAICANGHRHDL